MISIRKQLLFSILSVVALVTVLLIVATNISVRGEMDELYDENMKQIALVLAKTGLQDDEPAAKVANTQTALSGEEEFLIQVWQQGRLEYTSHPAIPFTLQPQEGFGDAVFQQGEWRFYRLTHDDDIIQIAQDLHKRHGVVAEIYNVFVTPILIQLPVLAGLIWFLVGFALKPLIRISRLIEQRSAAFLEPLPENDVPVEIRSMVTALNDLLMRLKSSLEAQRRFTADAAHELRTPLTAVRLQVDILKRATEETEKNEAIDTLEKGVNRSIRLVQQLLELARHEPESAELPKTKIQIEKIIDDVVDHAMPLSRAKSLTLKTDLAPNLFMTGNAAQLSVMIGNLLNNAILYTPENGNIAVSAHKTGDKIIMEITDDGIGIAPKERERIFDRFYRIAGNSATGSGLGLSIVRNIALTHGIDITIAEGPGGKGTLFRLTATAA